MVTKLTSKLSATIRLYLVGLITYIIGCIVTSHRPYLVITAYVGMFLFGFSCEILAKWIKAGND